MTLYKAGYNGRMLAEMYGRYALVMAYKGDWLMAGHYARKAAHYGLAELEG